MSILNSVRTLCSSLFCNQISSKVILSATASKTKLFSKQSASVLKTTEDVADYIENRASNILVMTGAGLSTPSGIPDFRSPDTGLYSNLQKYNLPYPEAIFDINFFMMDHKPFYSLAQELYPGVNYRPNIGHYFLYLLHRKNKLQKVYTQNIDGLERLAGIPDAKLMEAHGTFASASCTLCHKKHDPEIVKQTIIDGTSPPACTDCKGKVKPDIVFFGEMLPEAFWNFHTESHFSDLLLIIGTSLEVYPFASVAESVGHHIPRVLINKHDAGSIGAREKDLSLNGDLVNIIRDIVGHLGWLDELNYLMEQS